MTSLFRSGWCCLNELQIIFGLFGHELRASAVRKNKAIGNLRHLFGPKCQWIRNIYLGPNKFQKTFRFEKNARKLEKFKAKTSSTTCDDSEDNDGKRVNENPCKGKENLVAVLYKKQDIKIEEREKPKPCAGEVLVAMNCVGISYSDLNYYTKGKLPTPLVLGTEGTGIVAALGQGVQNLREGDRVTIEPIVNCGQCKECKNPESAHLCTHAKSCGLVPYDGLLTCYYTHAAEHCYKLPDCVTMEEGVLMNLLAKGINICSRCPIGIGTSVLIIGSGPIGLVSLIAAKASGATNTCVMCKFQERLKLAKLYNTKIVEIGENNKPEDIAQSVREELGCAPDITIDSSGSEVSLRLAIASTASGGVVALANVSNEEHKIPLFEAVHRDISILSVMRNANKFPAAIALAKSGTINLKPLISHHFYFEEVEKAVNTLMENKETANKVIIHIRPRDRNNKHPF